MAMQQCYQIDLPTRTSFTTSRAHDGPRGSERFGSLFTVRRRIISGVGGLLETLPGSRAAILQERYRARLPVTLSDLVGPDHGTVQLPLHVAWSGQTAFNLDLPKACMHMYRVVLAEGQRGDVAAYLNRELLVRQWPILRNLVSSTVRKVWEAGFPELAEGQPATP
jgi:hypothetical protein